MDALIFPNFFIKNLGYISYARKNIVGKIEHEESLCKSGIHNRRTYKRRKTISGKQ